MDSIKSKISTTHNKKAIILSSFIVCFVILVSVFTLLFIHLNNTLINNDRWDAMEKHVKMVHCMAFLTESQTLSGNSLNLGAWGGTNEVVYHAPITLGELSCRFSLKYDAYLYIIFDRQDDQYKAIRLSSSDAYPNSVFLFSVQGEILSSTPIQVPKLTPNEWHSLCLSVEESTGMLSVDNNEFMLPVRIEPRPGRFGFRNGSSAATVDDVRIFDAKIKTVYSESFDGRQRFKEAFFYALVATSTFFIGFFSLGWVLSKKFRKVVEYAFVTILTLIAVGIVFGLFHFFVLTKLYPVEPAISRDTGLYPYNFDELEREVVARYHLIPPDKGKRILFLGTSQTEGFGASSPSECYVSTLEVLLNNRKEGGSQVYCINAGKGAWDVRSITMFYMDVLADLPVDITVVDLLCNDSMRETPEDNFAENLELLASMILNTGSKLVFVIEPSSPEHIPKGWSLIPVFCRVGANLGIPVIDADKYLREKYDTGFLFWDSVHTTSYGHRLIAECLVSPILSMLN